MANPSQKIVYRVDPVAVESFLKKYPKVRVIMGKFINSSRGTMKSYVKFLDWMNKSGENQASLGGRPELVSSESFGSKIFYKYDWGGVTGWAEVFQYLYDTDTFVNDPKGEKWKTWVKGIKKENLDPLTDVYEDLDLYTVSEDGKLKGGADDPCWKGYEMVGTKTKNGKEVPNCVPRNESLNDRNLRTLTEGVDDPGILKCIFMAGGPGSGKSYTASEIFGIGKYSHASFASSGLKVVNSDAAFEKGLRDNGINPKDLGKIERENPELWDKLTGPDSVRTRAKAITQAQQRFYETGRLGMIVDGTGDSLEKIKQKKEYAESLGYDCYMVFVNTSLEVALERNRNRDRTLSDELVTDIWTSVQRNLNGFKRLFGRNIAIVDNTVYKPVDKDIQKAINSFIRRPTQNIIGKKWVETARALKRANLIGESKLKNMKYNLRRIVREELSKIKHTINESNYGFKERDVVMVYDPRLSRKLGRPGPHKRMIIGFSGPMVLLNDGNTVHIKYLVSMKDFINMGRKSI